MVSLIVDFNNGYADLESTERFLHKLPGCTADLHENRKNGVYKALMDRRYLPFKTVHISKEDVIFLESILHVPTKSLFDSICELVGDAFQDKVFNLTFEGKRMAATKKSLSFHVSRQVNSAWMKIVPMVGSVVLPTTLSIHHPPGKFCDSSNTV
jgi:hypothetical protein